MSKIKHILQRKTNNSKTDDIKCAVSKVCHYLKLSLHIFGVFIAEGSYPQCAWKQSEIRRVNILYIRVCYI